MPTIPVYTQRTTAQGASIRAPDIPDFISPALAKVGQGVSDVGEAMGKIAIRRQEQVDEQWLLRTTAKADDAAEKAYDEASDVANTDEDLDAWRNKKPVMENRLADGFEAVDALGSSAPSEAAAMRYKAHVDRLKVRMGEKSRAFDAAQRVGVQMADLKDMTIRAEGKIDTAYHFDLLETAQTELDRIAMFVKTMPGDEAAKQKVFEAHAQDVKSAYARKRIANDMADGTQYVKEALANNSDPILAGMTSEEQERVESELARQENHMSILRDRDLKEQKEKEKNEFIGSAISKVMGPNIKPSEMDTVFEVATARFGLETANQIRAVYDKRNAETNSIIMPQMENDMDALVLDPSVSEDDLLRLRVDPRFQGASNSGWESLVTRFKNKRDSYLRDRINDEETAVARALSIDNGFALIPDKTKVSQATAIFHAEVARLRAEKKDRVSQADLTAARQTSIEAVTGKAGAPVPTVLGIELTSLEDCEAARKEWQKMYGSKPTTPAAKAAALTIYRRRKNIDLFPGAGK